MSTEFLPKRIQEALEAILKSGEFYPCKSKKETGEVSLGFLTNEQKAIWSLYSQEIDKVKALIEELEDAPCYCEDCQKELDLPKEEILKLVEEQQNKKRDIIFTQKNVEFLKQLFWFCAEGNKLADKNLGIREEWELVERSDEEEEILSKTIIGIGIGGSSLGNFLKRFFG